MAFGEAINQRVAIIHVLSADLRQAGSWFRLRQEFECYLAKKKKEF